MLDTRAVEVLADRRADPVATNRVRAMLIAAARLGLPVRVSTAVLAEAFQGNAGHASTDFVLSRGVRAVTMGQGMGTDRWWLASKRPVGLLPYCGGLLLAEA